jgi:hypothetical protein
LLNSRLNFSEGSYSKTPSRVINRAPVTGEQASYTPNGAVEYCVVAYMPNPDNNGKILLVEGTSSEATEAGTNFLVSEDQLSNFQKGLHVTKFP